jgi:hypothetical protein
MDARLQKAKWTLVLLGCKCAYKLSSIWLIDWLIDWLINYLRFYVPLKNVSLIWIHHHCQWRAAKFSPMLGAQGLWAWRDLYHAIPAVTWDLGFSSLNRRTTPFNRLLRHTRRCGGSILTRILRDIKTYSLYILRFINRK